MNFRTTAILLVVLVVLGGYVWWSGRDEEPTEETATGEIGDIMAGDTTIEETEPAEPLLQIDPTAVQAINITAADGEAAILAQGSSGWSITVPEPNAADAATVTRAITDLVELDITRVITPTDDDLAPYGLAEPAYTIALAGTDGLLARLQLGDTNPDGSGMYVLRDDESLVYLVSNFTLTTLQGWVADPPVEPTPAPTPPPGATGEGLPPIPLPTPAP